MFLRPQHYQASDRHWSEQLATSSILSDPNCYGFAVLEIDSAALANRQFEIRRCKARFRDGTLVSFELGEEPDRVGLEDAANQLDSLKASLSDALESTDQVRVYLAIPRHDPIAANVSPPGESKNSRTHLVRTSVTDDTTGTNEQELEFRRSNIRVLLSTDDLTGFELLPMAQIRGLSNREAAPELDENFIPPVLAIDAWPTLCHEIMRKIYDLIGKKSEVLAEQAMTRQAGFSSSEPGDLERLVTLSKLLEAQGALRVMAFASGVHPREAYTELCRIVGQLSVFEPDRRLGELPSYDHDNLAHVFLTVKQRIEAMLSRVATLEYEQHYFFGVGAATLTASLDQKWLHSDWQCYVGVHRGELTEETCHRLLTGDSHLDWKLGSAEEVDRIFRLGLPGIELQPVEQIPRALPARSGWLYYRVVAKTAAWESVQVTQTMGIRLRDTLITNPEQLPGQRKVEVAFDNRTATLEFAVFAVPS